MLGLAAIMPSGSWSCGGRSQLKLDVKWEVFSQWEPFGVQKCGWLLGLWYPLQRWLVLRGSLCLLRRRCGHAKGDLVVPFMCMEHVLPQCRGLCPSYSTAVLHGAPRTLSACYMPVSPSCFSIWEDWSGKLVGPLLAGLLLLVQSENPGLAGKEPGPCTSWSLMQVILYITVLQSTCATRLLSLQGKI